jgi:cardiolipin synthase
LTASLLRPTRSGLVAAPVYFGLAVLWIWLAPHPGPLVLYLAYAVLLLALTIVLPGAANQVTIARAYLAAPAFAYALDPALFLPLALTVALAGLTDMVDGTVARRFDRPTRLGGALDPVVDGIFFGALAIGLAVGFAYPGWLAAVVVGRYALPALAGAGLLLAHRQVELRHTLFGQLSTVLIGVLLGGVALLRALGADTRAIVIGGEIVIPVATLLAFANLAWALAKANQKGAEVEKTC